MDVDEDGDYSDDDLDLLPDDTFHQLQEHAFTATQQAPREDDASCPPLALPEHKAPGPLAGGFERLSVGDDLGLQEDLDFPQQPSSDYGDLDDEMLDGEIYDAAEEPTVNAIQASRAANISYGESTQQELWRKQRYSVLSHRDLSLPQIKAKQPISSGANRSHLMAKEGGEHSSNQDNADGYRHPDRDVLQAQVLELRRERDELAKAKQAAEDAALAKSGEIAIVRANQTKTEKTFESKLQALQKLHQEESGKQRIEVERVLAEKQKIETEKGFLQNDIAEGNQQIKSLQRAVKAKDGTAKNVVHEDSRKIVPPTTPRKNNNAGFGDGFDSHEIQPVSPSRLPYRSKTSTPKAGSKRKRKPVKASPVKPLQLSQADEAAGPTAVDSNTAEQSFSNSVTTPNAPSPAITRPPPAFLDERFNFTQHVMNHRLAVGEKRTFEALSEHSFPSKPGAALSTIFLDEIATLSRRGDIENFPVALAQAVISMWKQCVDEHYKDWQWAPVHLLLDMTRYILCITPVTTASLLVDTLVEVIQHTADINVIPRVRQQPAKFLDAVNTMDCLELLKAIATDCSAHQEDTIRFWSRMRFDFIAMLLKVVQPIKELHITLGLLRKSVLKETFAMIVPPNDGKQEPSEMNLIDLLSRLLVETPRPANDEESYGVVEIAELRLSVLSLMEEMCLNKHSSLALANSQHAIGRLVWVMNDELDTLYDYRYGHEERAELVNHATRILFRLRTDHSQLINMQEKLKVIPGSGGVHKHLIALTRLALSEGAFFEEEIEDDVVECAFEMLEDLSSPEEAEALREAFSTARSR
ncbi:MAG: hypothetical protein Q9216_002714 [Gyalolechia sp. 2 TL-2023]